MSNLKISATLFSIFIFTAILIPQEPISFRSNALGGIVNDDLDLVYDPIELQFVDGVRLYSNLSNLTSNSENLLENISDDEFLFGISLNNPILNFLWHSVLIRFESSEISEPVYIDYDLDGDTDMTSYGTLINEYTAYDDSNNDGLYDYKTMVSQEKSNFSSDDSYSIILNNTLNLLGLSFGAKLSLISNSDSNNEASIDLGSGYDILSTR